VIAFTPPPTVIDMPPPPARLLVEATEFRFTLSRTTVKPGPAIVQLAIRGEDPHDLRLKRVGGTKTYATPVVAPGDTYDLVFRNLQVGRYQIWCGVANHAALGMRGVLESLKTSGTNWTFFSPAMSIAPGKKTGQYRLGTDTVLTNAKGESKISAEDYAKAVVDELENPKYLKSQMTIAY